MQYHSLKCRIQGITPLLMHCGQLSDPLNTWTKALKKITAKRDKTEADHVEMSRLEFFGGLYLNQGAPCLPAEMIESMLIQAAKKRKKGPAAKAGLICENDMVLLYEGPKEATGLWDNEQFRFTTGVRVNGNRCQRTRPIFRQWAADVEVHYLDELLNLADVQEFFKIAGISIGLGDWRPKFGRFEVVK